MGSLWPLGGEPGAGWKSGHCDPEGGVGQVAGALRQGEGWTVLAGELQLGGTLPEWGSWP